MTAPTERLIRRIRRDFGRGTDDEVIRRLTALAPDDSSERIQAALVLGSGGSWTRFENRLRWLELDWREVLVVGGLAGDDWAVRLAAELPPADEAGDRRGAPRSGPRKAGQQRSFRRDPRQAASRRGRRRQS